MDLKELKQQARQLWALTFNQQNKTVTKAPTQYQVRMFEWNNLRQNDADV